MTHLNKEQLLAVRHKDGPMLVLAGPGSGKTAVLTERIAHLIEKENILPEHILVLTFSKKAALEMQRRFHRRMHNSFLPVKFGTFHSVFYHILLKESSTKISIINDNQKHTLITDLCHKSGFYQVDFRLCSDLIDGISYYKNLNRVPDYINGYFYRNFPEFVSEYDLRLKASGFIDFDGMLQDTFELLNTKPDLLMRYQNQFRYILVDEFQDCNEVQYLSLKLLAGLRANLFAVGDDDQSIYGFRGADSRVIMRFMADFSNCKRVNLIRNYRCGGDIIRAAEQLVRNNTIRTDKPSQLPSVLKGSGLVQILKVANAYEEADRVLQIIKDLHNQGVAYRDIAVLYRSAQCASYLVELLSKSGVDTEEQNLNDWINSEYTEDYLAYFRIAAGLGSRSDYLRILNRPNRNLVRECIGDCQDYKEYKSFAETYYKDDETSFGEVCRLFSEFERIGRMSPFAGANYIRKRMGYGEYYRLNQRKSELSESGLFSLLGDYAKKFPSIGQLLEDVKLRNKTVLSGLSRNSGAGLTLMTIHASKGLEYDTVLVIGLQEGIFPSNRVHDLYDLEEERRLLYVAMTRAVNRLYLFARGNDEHGKRFSSFINELNSSDSL